MPHPTYTIQQPGNLLVFFCYHAVLLDFGEMKSRFLSSNKNVRKFLISHMVIMITRNKGQEKEHQVFLGKCPGLQW